MVKQVHKKSKKLTEGALEAKVPPFFIKQHNGNKFLLVKPGQTYAIAVKIVTQHQIIEAFDSGMVSPFLKNASEETIGVWYAQNKITSKIKLPMKYIACIYATLEKNVKDLEFNLTGADESENYTAYSNFKSNNALQFSAMQDFFKEDRDYEFFGKFLSLLKLKGYLDGFILQANDTTMYDYIALQEFENVKVSDKFIENLQTQAPWLKEYTRIDMEGIPFFVLNSLVGSVHLPSRDEYKKEVNRLALGRN